MSQDSEQASPAASKPSEKVRRGDEYQPDKGQAKITSFFTKHQESEQKVPKHSQVIQMRLQKQLSKLREQEQKLTETKEQLKRERQQNDLQFQTYIKDSQIIIADSLSSIYQRQREFRQTIDPAKGYFLKGTQQFCQGPYSKSSAQKIVRIKQQRINKPPNSFLYNYLEEQLSEEERRKNFMTAELETYKSELRLAMEQSNCLFTDTWPIVHAKYQTLELLGKGGFSEVYKAYNLSENKYCALKINYVSEYVAHHSHYLTKQYEIHKNLNHVNVVKMEDYFELTADRICLVLELCDGPELASYMKKKKHVPENQAKAIVRQIFSALSYLSSLPKKIIHYDLKPQNIMFHGGGIKLLDFGLCKQVEDENSRIALTNQGAGTFWYLPPEAFHDRNPIICSKVDVWSAGVIFYEMLYGCKPFGNNMSQVNLLNQGIILTASEVKFPAFPEVTEQTKMFLRQCLAYSTENRFSAQQAFNSPYLAI